MGNLILVLLEIYCYLQQWKNFVNPPRIDKVIAMVRVAPFLQLAALWPSLASGLLVDTIQPFICGSQEWAAQKQLNRLRCCLGRAHSYRANEPCIEWVHIDTTSWIPTNYPFTAPMWSSTKTAELIETSFRWLTQAGSRNNVLVGWAHWHNPVNTTELSVVPDTKHHCIQVQQHVCI